MTLLFSSRYDINLEKVDYADRFERCNTLPKVTFYEAGNEKNTRSAARDSVLDSRNITIVSNTKRPACGRVQAQQMMEGNEIR